MEQKSCLNLGCGRDIRKSTSNTKWVNVDHIKFKGVDKVADLNKVPFPFKNEEFDYINADGLIEYLDDVVAVVRELHRILKPGGKIDIRVPYCEHPCAFMDPTNKHYFSYQSFKCFEKEYDKFDSEFKEIDSWFKEVKVKLIFGKKLAIWNWVLEPIFNLMPLVYEGTPLKMFPAQYVKSTLIK